MDSARIENMENPIHSFFGKEKVAFSFGIATFCSSSADFYLPMSFLSVITENLGVSSTSLLGFAYIEGRPSNLAIASSSSIALSSTFACGASGFCR